MNHLLWYDGKRDAGSAFGMSDNHARTLARGLKRLGFKVVLTYHSASEIVPALGFEVAFDEYRKALEEE